MSSGGKRVTSSNISVSFSFCAKFRTAEKIEPTGHVCFNSVAIIEPTLASTLLKWISNSPRGEATSAQGEESSDGVMSVPIESQGLLRCTSRSLSASCPQAYRPLGTADAGVLIGGDDLPAPLAQTASSSR